MVSSGRFFAVDTVDRDGVRVGQEGVLGSFRGNQVRFQRFGALNSGYPADLAQVLSMRPRKRTLYQELQTLSKGKRLRKTSKRHATRRKRKRTTRRRHRRAVRRRSVTKRRGTQRKRRR